MDNTETNALSTLELNQLGQNEYRFFQWLQAVQDDLTTIPSMSTEGSLVEVGGNKVFPQLPTGKIGLLFLSTGTYEAVVIGGNDKWRRLYDGTTYDPATAIP